MAPQVDAVATANVTELDSWGDDDDFTSFTGAQADDTEFFATPTDTLHTGDSQETNFAEQTTAIPAIEEHPSQESIASTGLTEPTNKLGLGVSGDFGEFFQNSTDTTSVLFASNKEPAPPVEEHEESVHTAEEPEDNAGMDAGAAHAEFIREALLIQNTSQEHDNQHEDDNFNDEDDDEDDFLAYPSHHPRNHTTTLSCILQVVTGKLP